MEGKNLRSGRYSKDRTIDYVRLACDISRETHTKFMSLIEKLNFEKKKKDLDKLGKGDYVEQALKDFIAKNR